MMDKRRFATTIGVAQLLKQLLAEVKCIRHRMAECVCQELAFCTVVGHRIRDFAKTIYYNGILMREACSDICETRVSQVESRRMVLQRNKNYIPAENLRVIDSRACTTD